MLLAPEVRSIRIPRHLVSPAKGPRPPLLRGWLPDRAGAAIDRHARRREAFSVYCGRLCLGRGSFSQFAESLPHPDYVVPVVPEGGGDSVPGRSIFMGARRWGGVNSLLENQVPLRPWSQMASEVSAGPLGRIAPSAWTVWLGLAGSTVVLRFSGLPGWGGFPSAIGLCRFVPSFDEVGFVGTQRFSSALGGRFRSRGGSR